MIFLTVGTQLPFQRLVKIVNDWNVSNLERVIAQIGEDHGSYDSIESFSFLSASELDKYFSSADIVVGHAGIGTILNAIEFKKPVILFPRLASSNEHRNDHQISTCKKFAGVAGVYVASDEQELVTLLNNRKNLVGSKNNFSIDDKLVSYLENVLI